MGLLKGVYLSATNSSLKDMCMCVPLLDMTLLEWLCGLFAFYSCGCDSGHLKSPSPFVLFSF